jgi:hypothetical protein
MKIRFIPTRTIEYPFVELEYESICLPLPSDGPAIPTVDAEDIDMSYQHAYCRPTQRLRSLKLSTYNYEPFIRMPWYTGLRELTIDYSYELHMESILLCTNLVSLCLARDYEVQAVNRFSEFHYEDINRITGLRELTLVNINVGAVEHDGLTKLVLIQCGARATYGNNITMPNLKYLSTDGTEYNTTVLISMCLPGLTHLIVPYTNLKSSYLKYLKELEYIECRSIKGDITYLTKLRRLLVANTSDRQHDSIQACCQIEYYPYERE